MLQHQALMQVYAFYGTTESNFFNTNMILRKFIREFFNF